MHEAAFANAALPRRAAVLKMPLRDYSLAHELWLYSRNNPLATGGKVEKYHLIQAVIICAHTHEEILKLESDWLLILKMKIWRWRIRKEDIPLAIADFSNYRAAGSSEPETLEAIPRGKVEPQRASGAPFVLRLIQFLILKLRLTESQAMNYPHGLAKWHYCAFWEGEQALRIKNADEQSADDEKNAVRALVAQGVDINEAFKIVRAKEESCPAC